MGNIQAMPVMTFSLKSVGPVGVLYICILPGSYTLFLILNYLLSPSHPSRATSGRHNTPTRMRSAKALAPVCFAR